MYSFSHHKSLFPHAVSSFGLRSCMESINQKSALSFFCNISVTLNHVKLEKQFSRDCSQAIFKSSTTLQSNGLENISLLKKLFYMLIWRRKVFEGMKICFNCITWDCVMMLQSNANQCWVTWHYVELLSLALYSCMIFFTCSCWKQKLLRKWCWCGKT